ncbi:Protein CyaY [Burkholderia cepacia]|nr:Protein CyaY [Burkholderia cepacia]
MSDTEYLTRAEAVLAAVERTVDDANDGDHDIDLERNGSVLTLTSRTARRSSSTCSRR